MRKAVLIMIVFVGILAAVNCKENTTGPSSQDLAGTWRATKAEFVSVANSSLKVDIVSQGSTVTLVLNAGSFTLTINDSRVPTQNTNGTYTSTSDTLTLVPSGLSFSWVFEMTLSGDNLTLNGASMQFDFSGNAAYEEAKLNMTLARQ
jgi:hypothetical protein